MRFGSKPSAPEEESRHRPGNVSLRRVRPGFQQETSAGFPAVKPTLLDTGRVAALLDRSTVSAQVSWNLSLRDSPVFLHLRVIFFLF